MQGGVVCDMIEKMDEGRPMILKRNGDLHI